MTAYDVLGNKTIKDTTSHLKIDKTQPSLTIVTNESISVINVDGKEYVYYDSTNKNIGITASDNLSGIKMIQWAFDNGTLQTENVASAAVAPLVSLSEGKHTLRVITIDNAGN